MDYRHHWQDVVVGSLLGTVISYFTYRQYYPSLASDDSHRPHSPRIRREEDEVETLPTHRSRPSSPEHDDQVQFLNDPQVQGYKNPFPPSGSLGNELDSEGHRGYVDHSFELQGSTVPPLHERERVDV